MINSNIIAGRPISHQQKRKCATQECTRHESSTLFVCCETSELHDTDETQIERSKDRTTDEERYEKDGTMGFTSKDIETFTPGDHRE